LNPIEPLLLSLWEDLHDVRVLWQAGAIALSVAAAVSLSYVLLPRMRTADPSRWEIGLGGLRRLMFPLIALVLLLIARWLLAHYQSVSVLNIALPLLTAMAIIRVVAYALRLVLAPGGVLSVFERTIGWLVWIGVVLYVFGMTSDIIDYFDSVSFYFGKQRISLLLIGQAVLWVVAAMLLALWIGRVLEERLMAAHGLDMTLRVMLTKVMRALLVLFAILVALPAVGVDLTALSVFGGAIGVGIGFGLQKIASNYISGFIILLDRSVRIGDLVTIEKHTGQLSKMTARYVVVRGLDGTEAIIPNETLITSTVINQTYTDSSVCVPLPVRISYQSDLDLAVRLLLDVAKRHARAKAEPAPQVLITSFADNGIELELGVWVADPEEGKTNLRSDLYYGIWQEFKLHGIEIPYPQREVRLLAAAGAAANQN
jgi:small-conductance mechanosensitive channel